MPTASERAAAEAETWQRLARDWSPNRVPELFDDVAPSERAVVGFHDPATDLARRAREWGFAMDRVDLDELARFAAGLAETERRAWAEDTPDLAMRAYEARRQLLADRISHWAIPWLDAVTTAYPGHRSTASSARDDLLRLADEMRIAPALAGSEGLTVPGEDAYGPIGPGVPLDALLGSLWSGLVVLRATTRSLHQSSLELATVFAEAGPRWISLAQSHPGSARLWLDLANRARTTAAALREADGGEGVG